MVCASNCAREQPLSVIPNQMLALALWLDEDKVGVYVRDGPYGQFRIEASLFPKLIFQDS